MRQSIDLNYKKKNDLSTVWLEKDKNQVLNNKEIYCLYIYISRANLDSKNALDKLTLHEKYGSRMK